MSLLTPTDPTPLGTPEVTVLTSADPLPAGVAAFDRWRSGVTARSTAAIVGASRELCGTDELEERAAEHVVNEFVPFEVYVTHGCAGRVDEPQYRSEAETALVDKSAWLVGRELWTGATSSNPSLQAEATDIGGTGPVVNVVDHLIQNFEDATQGGRCMVHLPAVALSALTLANYATRVGNRLVTPTGHLVVAGPGYPAGAGAYGPAGAAAASDEVWVYVTTVPQVGLGPVDVMDVGRGIASRQNLYEVYVWRPVLVRFDTEFVFAAKAEVTGL